MSFNMHVWKKQPKKTLYYHFDWLYYCMYISIPTLAARVSLSPDSPTQMFRHSFLMCRFLITFLELSLGAFFSFLSFFNAGGGTRCNIHFGVIHSDCFNHFHSYYEIKHWTRLCRTQFVVT